MSMNEQHRQTTAIMKMIDKITFKIDDQFWHNYNLLCFPLNLTWWRTLVNQSSPPGQINNLTWWRTLVLKSNLVEDADVVFRKKAMEKGLKRNIIL